MPNLPNLTEAERELERLHAESTGGPWEVVLSVKGNKDNSYVRVGIRGQVNTRFAMLVAKLCANLQRGLSPQEQKYGCDVMEKNADFIAAAHNLTPTLLTTISSLRGEVVRLTAERKELILKLSESNMQIGRLQGKLEFSELAKSPLVDVNAICAERDAALAEVKRLNSNIRVTLDMYKDAPVMKRCNIQAQDIAVILTRLLDDIAAQENENERLREGVK